LVERSDETKVVPGKTIDPNAEKIHNPLTNRYVNNTPANRKKIDQQQTLNPDGKKKKRTRKNKKNTLANRKKIEQRTLKRGGKKRK